MRKTKTKILKSVSIMAFAGLMFAASFLVINSDLLTANVLRFIVLEDPDSPVVESEDAEELEEEEIDDEDIEDEEIEEALEEDEEATTEDSTENETEDELSETEFYEEGPVAGYEDEVLTDEGAAEKNPFTDTEMVNLSGQAAAFLYKKGIIGGYPDGTFRGSRPVNRAEAAKFLLLAIYDDISKIPDLRNDGKFWDVLDDQWYTPFIMNAYAYGIMGGNPDGSMKPANTIITAEFMKMITIAFDLETNLSYVYKDVPKDAWFAKYAGAAQRYNLFPDRAKYLNPGEEMEYLNPGDELTRDEVAVAIYQYLNRVADVDEGEK